MKEINTIPANEREDLVYEKIDDMTFLVRAHFNPESKENLQNKLIQLSAMRRKALILLRILKGY